MTPHDPPDDVDHDLSPDEEAVLAVLDDDADAEQRRRVARDPGLRRALEDQRAAREALATGAGAGAADDSTLDAVRAAALAAAATGPGLPERDEAASTDEASAAVLPITARRAAPPWRGLPAVAAVVIVLMVLGGGLLLTDRGEPTATGDTAGDALSEASADMAAQESAGPAGERMEAADAMDGAPPDGPSAVVGDESALLRFADEDELRLALQTVDVAALGRGGDTLTAAPLPFAVGGAIDDEAARCGRVLEGPDPGVGALEAASVVLVDSERILVLVSPVLESEAGEQVLLSAVDPLSCVPRFAVLRDRG